MGKKFSNVTIIFFFISAASSLGVIAGLLQGFGYFQLLGPIPFFLALVFLVSIIITILLVVRDRVKVQYSKLTKVSFKILLLFNGLFLAIPCYVVIILLIDPMLMDEYSPWFYVVPFAAPIIFLGWGISGLILLVSWVNDKSMSSPTNKTPKPKIRYSVVTKLFFALSMLCLGMAVYGLLDYSTINTEYAIEIGLAGLYSSIGLGIITFILAMRDKPTLEELNLEQKKE